MEYKDWLETAIRLDLHLGIYEEYGMRIADLIYTKVHRAQWRNDYKSAFCRVIANLRVSHELGVPIHYSRDTNRRHNGISGWCLRNLIDKMEDEDLIEQHNGYYDSEFGGKETRMWASKDLIGLFLSIQPEDVVLDPPDMLVELKDRPPKKNGRKQKPKRIPYQRTVETDAMTRQLKEYGEMMLNHQVELHVGENDNLSEKTEEQLVNLITKYRYTYITLLYPTVLPNTTISILPPTTTIRYYIPTITYEVGKPIGVRFRYCWLHRSFSETFSLGGRYYGAPWQFIGSELRKFITIDGQETVEPDYSGHHLRMLYHLQGIDYQRYPYAFGKAEWRPLCKDVALIMINCRAKRYLTNSINKRFRDKGRDKEFGAEILNKDIIKKMVAECEAFHDPIKGFFCSDVGIKLQYIDSEITSYILDYFISRDIPILPIHDSYVVAENNRQELHLLMMEAYEYHLGFQPVISANMDVRKGN